MIAIKKRTQSDKRIRLSQLFFFFNRERVVFFLPNIGVLYHSGASSGGSVSCDPKQNRWEKRFDKKVTLLRVRSQMWRRKVSPMTKSSQKTICQLLGGGERRKNVLVISETADTTTIIPSATVGWPNIARIGVKIMRVSSIATSIWVG